MTSPIITDWPPAAVAEATHPLAAEINDLERRASASESVASDLRWEIAERVARLNREEGWTQQQIADTWRRPDGTTYSRQHVGFALAAHDAFGYLSSADRPPWNEAYNSDEVRGGGKPKDSELIQQSTTNEWYTPIEYLDAARIVMGGIDLDPASCAEANETVQAKQFYTRDDDGLSKRWAGRVWLNPPYGRDPGPGPFVERLDNSYRAGSVTAGIALVNAHCTETEWFKPLWDGVICFTDHRIDFAAGTEDRSGSTHGSAIVYFGDNPKAFADAFGQFGPIVRRWP